MQWEPFLESTWIQLWKFGVMYAALVVPREMRRKYPEWLPRVFAFAVVWLVGICAISQAVPPGEGDAVNAVLAILAAYGSFGPVPQEGITPPGQS